VLDREGLENGLLDLSTLLGVVEERLKLWFMRGAQFCSLPSFLGWAYANDGATART
jgi:hypothetical protein